MPFKMGETLNDNNNLDIREEKRLTQERQRQLIIEKANEEAMSSAMTDLGIQRFLIFFSSRNHIFLLIEQGTH